MKRALIAAAVLALAAVSASAQINLSKSLVRVANPGALAMPGMAMPSGVIPNNYASTPSVSFDPNAGSAGTVYVTYTFTGTTQGGPMCTMSNARHYPQIGVQLHNNGVLKTLHYAAGYEVSPCAAMNQTLTVALDLGQDGCDLDLLGQGVCSLNETEDQVFCTVAGPFVFFPKKWQTEGATSATQTVDAAPPYPQAPWCGDESDPPDFYIKTSISNATGFHAATATLIRWQFYGLSFWGIPWLKISFVGLAADYPPGPKPVCTQYDNGCRWGAAFCTGSPNGPETKLQKQLRDAIDAAFLGK